MREHMVVDEEEEKTRLDIYLSRRFTERFSRSQIRKLIDLGAVTVGGRDVTAHYRVKKDDEIKIEWQQPGDDETRAENIPLEILHEDEEIVVVNKPVGMVVHPAHGNLTHTMVNALLYHFKELSHSGDPIRPGIVHRLDKDTSGVLVVAKNDRAHRLLANQFKDHTIERVYHAVVRGVVQHDEGVCEQPVGRAFLNRKKVIVKPSGGKAAITFFRVLKRFKNASLLEVRPQTGRTHQIRVHLASLNHPVLGDGLYGVRSPWIQRHSLHASGLGFAHPKSSQRVYFASQLPKDIRDLLSHLEAQG
ncbi:MAG: RluA family pseudouridine synthase [Candidatus Omnitrophota bacterium]|nr:RluA family pseudouridine synthase [Candidatus Omnitrophota bacterium]